MKRFLTYISIFLVLALVLVSCGGEEPEPTTAPEPEVQPTEVPEEPTEVPTEEPTPEPTEEPAEEPAPVVDAASIMNIVWQWEAYQDTAGQNDVSVDDPTSYTVTLLDDGTASIKADCNQVSREYTLDGSSITFSSLGISTLAMCPPDSLDQQFLGYLDNVVTWVMNDDEQLVFNLMADAGNMIFNNGGAYEMVEEPMPELRTDNLEGETITFYHFGDLSGAYAAITSPLIHGFEDAVAALNEAGGIRGANIEIKFADTAGSVDEAVAAYDRFTSEDDNILMMFNYGSGEAEALAGRYAEDQIPALSAGLSAVAFYGPGSGFTFGVAPIYTDQFGLFLDWLTANWADYKPASAGDEIKIAYISWPTAYGQGALSPESRAYAESLGVEIVAEELIDVSPTADATTAILNAQAAGANVIYNNTLAFGPASILNGLSALGVRDQFLFGANNWAMDLATYAFLQDPALAVGMISPFPYLWWNDADHPGIQYAESVFVANERPAGEHNVGYLLSVAMADIAKTAVEAAIDVVGFDALTGADVQQALINMGPYEALDGVMRVDYSGDNRSPHVSQIRMIQGGPDAFNMLQDWTDTPDLRPADNFSNQ